MWFAQGLEWARPELVQVAFVRLDVMDDGRFLDDFLLKAALAKRVVAEKGVA